MSKGSSCREGFALLTVLWVLSGMTVLGVLLNRTASEALGTTSNRTDAIRAGWTNEGCLSRARAAMDESLRNADDAETAWRALDEWLPHELAVQGCDVSIVPTGMALDVNAANPDRALALLLAAGISYERADSLAAAIMDWRDDDEEPVRGGAERFWYRAAGRVGPRNGPFVARQELRLVRGLEHPGTIADLLDVETGRVLLTRAPAALLLTLPGFGQEAVTRLVALRASGPIDLLQIATSLSPAGRAELQSHMLELASLTTSTPDAWIVTSRARRPATGGSASIELRLVRSGGRAAVMRHRSSPWS